METKPDSTTAATPGLGRYEIDTSRSSVAFTTRHLFGLAPVRGTFAIRTGTVYLAEPLGDSSVRVDVDAASFHTGNAQRDGAVRSPRFLDTGRHPVITFVLEHIDGGTLTGSLTVRDVTRRVSLSIQGSAVSPRSFSLRAATRIDRTDFGVTASRGLAGRYLDMALEVECVRK